MDPGTRDRLVMCGQAAIEALLLDSDHDSPNDVRAAIKRLHLGLTIPIVGLRGPMECPAGACDGCDGFHHWIPECADGDTVPPPGIEPHPAILARRVYWYECKHCDAWCEECAEE